MPVPRVVVAYLLRVVAIVAAGNLIVAMRNAIATAVERGGP